jgi:cysteine desulfurase
MGLSNHLAQSALRFSVGRFNSEEEIDYTVAAVAAGVKLLRSQSPIWQLYQEGIDVDSYL